MAILHLPSSIFSAPLWLTLLLPWAFLAIYLLVGQRDRVAERIVTATKTHRHDSAEPPTGPHLAPAALGKLFDGERRAA